MQSMDLLRELSEYSGGTRRTKRWEEKAREIDRTEDGKAKNAANDQRNDQSKRESDQSEMKWEQSDQNEGIPIEVIVYPGTASQEEAEKGYEGEQMEEEEEEEEEPTPEQMARWRRRRLLPNEVVSDICEFMSFAEGSRLYTSSGLFVALLEPKRKLCLAMFLKRVEETRQKLDKTIEEVNERRRHVVQLTENIGTINARLAEMGNHLANLDTQIVVNHLKLDELHKRIAAMKEPMGKLEK